MRRFVWNKGKVSGKILPRKFRYTDNEEDHLSQMTMRQRAQAVSAKHHVYYNPWAHNDKEIAEIVKAGDGKRSRSSGRRCAFSPALIRSNIIIPTGSNLFMSGRAKRNLNKIRGKK